MLESSKSILKFQAQFHWNPWKKKINLALFYSFQLCMVPLGLTNLHTMTNYIPIRVLIVQICKCILFCLNTHIVLRMHNILVNFCHKSYTFYFISNTSLFFKKKMPNPFSNFHFKIQKQICKNKSINNLIWINHTR